jgi:hypothetical protein
LSLLWRWLILLFINHYKVEEVGARLSIHIPYLYGNIPYGYGNMEPYGHVWPYGNNFGLRPQHHHPVQLLGFYKL